MWKLRESGGESFVLQLQISISNNLRLNTATKFANRNTIPNIKPNAKKYDLKRSRRRTYKANFPFLIP